VIVPILFWNVFDSKTTVDELREFSRGSSYRTRPYASHMHTIELTDEELRLVVNAVRSFLDDFGHEEAELLRKIKELLAKLQNA